MQKHHDTLRGPKNVGEPPSLGLGGPPCSRSQYRFHRRICDHKERFAIALLSPQMFCLTPSHSHYPIFKGALECVEPQSCGLGGLPCCQRKSVSYPRVYPQSLRTGCHITAITAVVLLHPLPHPLPHHSGGHRLWGAPKTWFCGSTMLRKSVSHP